MTINITIPSSWSELSQQQLRELLVALTDAQRIGLSLTETKTILLLQWANLDVICKYADDWLVNDGDKDFVLTASQIAAAIGSLSWIDELPERPVRLDTIDGATAARADLSQDFSFDKWLSCETLWQWYMSNRNEECLRLMTAHLYGKDDIHADEAELLGTFYWWAAVKQMTAQMYPHFFVPAEGDDASPVTQDSLRRSMDAQIRALTKGDITKEKQILEAGCMRALSELDSQAAEYAELQKLRNK